MAKEISMKYGGKYQMTQNFDFFIAIIVVVQ